MINSKNIAPDSVAYVARRGLLPKHAALFEAEEEVIQKRTSGGYKVKHRSYVHGRLLLDSGYYVSTSKEEVDRALLNDAKHARDMVLALVAKLDARVSDLCEAIAPGCQHDQTVSSSTRSYCSACGKEWKHD